MKHFKAWNKLVGPIATLVPTMCMICGRNNTSHYNLCVDCEHVLPWIESSCVRCGVSLPVLKQGSHWTEKCGACTGKTFAVDKCRGLFHYSNPIDSLISQFKFRARLDIGLCFGHLIGNVLKNESHADRTKSVLIPVPMHFQRFLQRGFNQSWELTQIAGRVSGLPVMSNLAVKSRHTPAQSSLTSAAQRKTNTRDSFAVPKNLQLNDVSSITIIDDVVTTMSTVSALASSLKCQGIQRVEVFCVARASPHR